MTTLTLSEIPPDQLRDMAKELRRQAREHWDMNNRPKWHRLIAEAERIERQLEGPKCEFKG